MTDAAPPPPTPDLRDAVLGRSLAETARLNGPGARAAEAARAAVGRPGMNPCRRRRLLRAGVALIALVLVLAGTAAVLLRPLLAPG